MESDHFKDPTSDQHMVNFKGKLWEIVSLTHSGKSRKVL